MMHPEFVSRWVFTIFTCGDDPESSEVLSKPVASAFDFAFTYNIACVDMYKSWGCKNVGWLLYQLIELADPTLTEQSILCGERKD